MSEPVVLCLNRGSSSLKFSLFDGEHCQLHGAVEGLGTSHPTAWSQPAGEPARKQPLSADPAAALRFALATTGHASPAAIVHRLVRGGRDDGPPAFLDDELLRRLHEAIPLAPLHLPAAIEAIEMLREQCPTVPQIACFDTAFHGTLPEVARRLPISDQLHARGLHRYGYHGLSCEHVVATLGEQLPARVVIAHLGNGASLTAVLDGRSVDTTMGLTPVGGILMGTRTGDLDPGLLLHLVQQGMSAAQLGQLVEQEGGLRAVGGTSDMQLLLERRSTDPRAALAVDMFTRAVRKAIGALAATLEGLDMLVFTGGIGEHADAIRSEVCGGLGFLGVRLDPGRNARHDDVLSPDASPVTVRRVVASEDLVMATHARRLLTRR